jgi:hypothetical protein
MALEVADSAAGVEILDAGEACTDLQAKPGGVILGQRDDDEHDEENSDPDGDEKHDDDTDDDDEEFDEDDEDDDEDEHDADDDQAIEVAVTVMGSD